MFFSFYIGTTEPIKRVTSHRNTKTELKNKVQTEEKTRQRPVTRSMRSNTKKTNPKETNNKKTLKEEKMKTIVDITPEKEIIQSTKNCLSSEEKTTNEIDEETNLTEIMPENDDGKLELHDGIEKIDQNVFSVLPTLSLHSEEKQNFEEDESKVETVPLMTEKTEFEPPEVFKTFKFNQKVIFESIQDFIPSNSNPADAELFATSILEINKKEENKPDTSVNQELPAVLMVSKTPVLAFKELHGMVSKKTPTSTPKRLSMSAKRASLTPNPNNFLHKVEDPIAARTETPKSRRSLNLSTKEDKPVASENESESVKHFTNLVVKEEDKFKTSVAKWEKVLEDKTTPEERNNLFFF